MGGDPSNQAPFVIGRIPLVMSVDPAGVSAGDIVTIKGRGFPLQPALNDLKIGGVGALVISAFDNELKAIVPWAATGDAPLELRVPRSENVGAASMTIAPRPDPLEFRFVAGPIRDDPAHDHAVLATALGPAFVLSASGGRSAADRAYEAQQRLAEAAVALKASLTADFEVRDLEGNPALGLTGKAEPLLEVTAEDAAAYNEDWTGLRGKGGAVTRARLALWWGAVARDLVLLLIRGEKPHFAAELAPEGRVLVQVGDAGRKTGQVRPAAGGGRKGAGRLARAAARGGVARAGVGQGAGRSRFAWHPRTRPLAGRFAWRESGPARRWKAGTRKYVTVTFTKDGGTLTYERALTMSVPIENVQAQKAAVRFSAEERVAHRLVSRQVGRREAARHHPRRLAHGRGDRHVRAGPEEVALAQAPALSIARRIIPISSGKGGVGKTTLALNYALASRAHGRTVLIDLDTGTSSVRNCVDTPVTQDLYHFFKKGARLADCVTALDAKLDPAGHYRSFGFVAVPQAPDRGHHELHARPAGPS